MKKWQIVRWLDLPAPRSLEAGIDRIFFDASATRSFTDADARAAFRERWLGRYLERFPQWFYVVTDADAGSGDSARALGYLAGCLEDPARSPLFADIGYFDDLRDLTARFPAHLHINLAEEARSRGIGTALIERFCIDAQAAGSCGVHVVTSASSRNVTFYNRCGFSEVRRFASGAIENVMLARALG